MGRLLNALAMGGIAAIAYRAGKRRSAAPAPQCDLLAARSRRVRDAGPEAQEGIAAEDWDLVDEQSDESFPASDPPANY